MHAPGEGGGGSASRPLSFERPLGFTLTELAAIIGIVAVLSVIAFSRLDGTFAGTRGTYDQLYSQVAYGRKAAIAQRRPVFVRVDATQSRLCYSAAGLCTGGDAAPSPTGAAPFTVSFPAGVTATTGTFQFDALGQYLTSAGATPGSNLSITVTGNGSHAFTVERDTGYVHP